MPRTFSPGKGEVWVGGRIPGQDGGWGFFYWGLYGIEAPNGWRLIVRGPRHARLVRRVRKRYLDGSR